MKKKNFLCVCAYVYIYIVKCIDCKLKIIIKKTKNKKFF